MGYPFGKPNHSFKHSLNRKLELFRSSPFYNLYRIITFSLMVQFVLFIPIVYWIFQNYSIIEIALPENLNLVENIHYEKKWILFLILSMGVVQAVWNMYIWKQFLKNQLQQNTSKIKIDRSALPDEADYPRRAS